MTATVVVVGAGPAGLSAASAAARAGARTVLFEEGAQAGGQLLYRLLPAELKPGEPAVRPRELASRLVSEAQNAGVEIHTESVVAGCFGGHEILVAQDDGAQRITYDAMIVAAGSTDLPYPFPGATFPGVFSARALQNLLNRHRVRPGRRFAIIGQGDDAEELMADVLLAGGEVAWSGIAPAPFLEAIGHDGVVGLRVGQDRIAVDVIAIAVGRQADPALATMAGTPIGFSAELGGLVPLVDVRVHSPVDGIFVAGDAAGIGSVGEAIAEGNLAGVAAAAAVGLATDRDVDEARAVGGAALARRISLRAAVSPVAVQPYE